MVDILDWADPRQFGGVFRRFAKPRTGRSKATEHAMASNETDIEVAEAHDMIASLEFSDANKFADEGLAHEGSVTLPHDFTRATHASDLMVGVIPGVLEVVRHGPWRRRVDLARWPLAQGFVRPLFVIMLAKSIETGLLFTCVTGWRTRGLLLQSAMHPLMSAIILGR